MKKYLDGKYIEMTQAEIDELNEQTFEIPVQPEDKVSDRLDVLEKGFTAIKSILDKFGMGVK